MELTEIDNQLFWKKYRPSTMDDIILLPRVRKAVENGITVNMIFHGSYGMGKTALTKILLKKHPYIKFNASKDTGIEQLRTKVTDFCEKMSILDDINDMKVVFLDEFERTSSAYQDALKGFIEEHERNVRFLATTNHLNKISGGMLSRFIPIDFNPKNSDEIKYLKSEYAKRLKEISIKEEIDIQVNDIVNIVNSNFPDMRQMVTILQYIKSTNDVSYTLSSFNVNNIDKELFDHILDENKEFIDTYRLVINNFGAENISDMIYLLGRPFIEYSIGKDTELIDKMDKIVDVVTDYSNMLNNVLDPIVLGTSLIGKIKNIIKTS